MPLPTNMPFIIKMTSSKPTVFIIANIVCTSVKRSDTSPTENSTIVEIKKNIAKIAVTKNVTNIVGYVIITQFDKKIKTGRGGRNLRDLDA